MMLDKKNATFSMILMVFLLLGCQNSESKLHAQASSKKDTKAHVVLTEYSDFECPACGYYYPIVEKLDQHYGDKLEVVHKYFPLNVHPFSMLAARAAEAAKNQGKFKAMYGLLFQNQKSWSTSGDPQHVFEGYAKDIGLDMKQFKADLNATPTQKVVMEQKKEGIDQGVNSTPSFYINGEKVINQPPNYEAFKALLDVYMKEAQQGTNGK